MRVFFDTSAFVKRYVEEPGTEKVLDICGQAEQLVLCIICLPEMISTLNRFVREGKLQGAAITGKCGTSS
jgi:predicted nucleic acid-binding protein